MDWSGRGEHQQEAERDKAAGKKVSRKKMNRSSYARMCVLDKVRKYRRPQSVRRGASAQSPLMRGL